MRITNNITTRNALHTMQESQRKVDEAQRRASSGLRVQTASDDPSAAASIVKSGSSLRAIEQYERNINSANSRLAVEEQALGSITQLLERAKELAISQGTATASAGTRLTAKAEIDQLALAAVQIGNQQHEGEFLFGGDQSDTAPLSGVLPPFSSAPPTGNRTTEVASSLRIKAGHNATEAFLTSDVLNAFHQLSTALGADDLPGILSSIDTIDTAHSNVQVMIGETGAQVAQLDVTTANLRALDTSLRTFKSNLEDADLERAVTDLVSRQTAYQAAMLSTSRIMGMSLADYLR